MARIRGKVDPSQANKVPFQAAFGLGQWNMEYIIRDRNGRQVDRGTFVADRDEYFDVNVNASTPGTVEVKCLGGWAYSNDSETVNVFSNRDVVNLNRRLKPK